MDPIHRIAVAPHDHAWAAAMNEAVGRGGGTPSDLSAAEGLIWLGPSGPALDAALHDGIRWVQLRSAGIEHFIAVGNVDDRRMFGCTRGVYAETVAEHILALMLAGSRKLAFCARSTTWASTAAEGRELRGATVAIVGAGGIGRALIRLLQPFAMTVIAVTRSGREVPGATRNLPASALVEVWPVADFVVLAAPATADTAALVDADVLRAMPAHAWLINVARGSLIDTAALVDALRRDEIAGAALDVTEPEPLPDGHPLWTLPNALITPHVANPPASHLRTLLPFIEANVARVVAGETPEGLVDLSAGY